MATSRGRRLVSKLWVQMVTLVVVVVAGFAINSFHGIFGSQDNQGGLVTAIGL